jgi:hypothetical protein
MYDVIIMFNNILEDFLNNPLSSSFNSVWQKMALFSVFDITEATGLQKGQGQGPCFEIIERNKMG